MNYQDAIDRMTEPLYLAVAGHEIDRLRSVLYRVLTMESEDVMPNGMIISISGPEFEITYSPDKKDVADLLDDPAFSRIVKGMKDAALGSLAASSAREHCMVTKPVLESVEMPPSPNIDICSMAVLQIHRNSGKVLEREGHYPVFIIAEYDQLNRERKFVFSMMWRRLRIQG